MNKHTGWLISLALLLLSWGGLLAGCGGVEDQELDPGWGTAETELSPLYAEALTLGPDNRKVAIWIPRCPEAGCPSLMEVKVKPAGAVEEAPLLSIAAFSETSMAQAHAPAVTIEWSEAESARWGDDSREVGIADAGFDNGTLEDSSPTSDLILELAIKQEVEMEVFIAVKSLGSYDPHY